MIHKGFLLPHPPPPALPVSGCKRYWKPQRGWESSIVFKSFVMVSENEVLNAPYM